MDRCQVQLAVNGGPLSGHETEPHGQSWPDIGLPFQPLSDDEPVFDPPHGIHAADAVP